MSDTLTSLVLISIGLSALLAAFFLGSATQRVDIERYCNDFGKVELNDTWYTCEKRRPE